MRVKETMGASVHKMEQQRGEEAQALRDPEV